MSSPDADFIPPPSPHQAAQLANLALICWVTFGIGLVSAWVTGPVGWVIALVKQNDAIGTIYHSHFRAIIRGGIICFFGYAVGWALILTFIGGVIGWPIVAITWIYNIVIVIRGLLRLSERRPY